MPTLLEDLIGTADSPAHPAVTLGSSSELPPAQEKSKPGPKKSKPRLQPSICEVDLADLIPDPANTRVHPDRSKAAISASVRELGAARSIVVDGSNVVRAGNGTLEAARAAGITKALIIETDGKQLVVVKRPSWSSEQALAYSVADNRTGELSHFDEDSLKAMVNSLAGNVGLVGALGFDEKEIAKLLAASSLPMAAPAAPEVREVSFTAAVAPLEHECPKCGHRF